MIQCFCAAPRSESVWMDQWCCCRLFFFHIPLLDATWIRLPSLLWGQQRRWWMQGLSTSAGQSISLNFWGCTNCRLKLLLCQRPFLLTCGSFQGLGKRGQLQAIKANSKNKFQFWLLHTVTSCSWQWQHCTMSASCILDNRREAGFSEHPNPNGKRITKAWQHIASI